MSEPIISTIEFKGYSTSDYTGKCFAVAAEDYEAITDIMPSEYDMNSNIRGLVTLRMNDVVRDMWPPSADDIAPQAYRFKITIEAISLDEQVKPAGRVYKE